MTEPTGIYQGAESDRELTWKSVWQSLRALGARLSHATTDRRVLWSMLALILLLGAVLRLTGLDWDEGQHLHPDERFLTMVENALEWPKSIKEYFDTAVNPLNPYNRGQGMYVYGLSPVIVAKFLGQITGKTGYHGVYLAGRAMSAVMDLLCVLLVFLIGRRLYDARVGLLGALLLSLTALDIQQSHYFTVDTSTTFYVTLALYFAVRVAQGEGWGSLLGLGIAFGLAVSAKISVLSFLLIIGLAYLLRMAALWTDPASGVTPSQSLMSLRGKLGRLLWSFRVETEEEALPPTKQERLFLHATRVCASALVVLVAAILVFRIAQPQAFMGPGFFGMKLNPQWQNDMKTIQRLVSGQDDYPPSHQWAGREPVWYMLKNMLLWGMGLPLGLAVWATWGLMAYEIFKKHRWEHLLIWTWMTFTFFYQSVQFVKTVRYLLPIYPTMALVGAYGLVRLWDWGRGALRRWGEGWRKWAGYGALGLVGLAVLGTAFWAFAFTSIYTRPVTRVTASRWIYQNIPPGSTISFENWDDPLPLNIDGHNAGVEYRHIKMDPYWEDIPEKREAMYQWIDQTEYIVLSSNRLYESIPRLPTRYPMTTRYYEALFSGELGYDLIQTFTSRPRLFGIEINDDHSDESFTVYDHPKVLIFKKRADFTMKNVLQLLGGYDLERIVRSSPKQLSAAPNNLMLDEQSWETQQQGGTWSDLFNRDGVANKIPTLVWLLALALMGVIAFPLGFVAFRRMRDRGYILSKTLGLLLVGYLSWLLPSLKVLPFTRGTIAGVIVALAAASALVAWRQREALGLYLRARWRLLAANELLFLGFFLLFWLIRRANPDLWHPAMGGEKPMDFAYLNAVIKSTTFPAYDPWFAGGYLNYYYLGLVMVATLIKFTGILPTVAYNLAIPTFFALTAMGASCVAFNLIPAGEDEGGWWPRALRFGLLGALLVAVVGNLGEVQLLLNGLQALGSNVHFTSSIPGLAPLVKTVAGLWAMLFKGQQLPFRPEWWYWNASRVMQNGEINEFPFFTFLYADLHAHLTAMPFALLALGLATSFVARPLEALSRLARDLVKASPDNPALQETDPQAGTELDTLALDPALPDAAPQETAQVDVPYMTDGGVAEALPVRRSAWWQGAVARVRARLRALDWALIWQVTLLALAGGELWTNNSWDFPTYLGISVVALAIGVYADRQRIDEQGIWQFILRAGYVVVLSVLLYWPFHSHFGTAYTSVEPWKGERTTIGAYLIIHGAALFILVSYLLAVALEPGTRNGIVRAVRLFLRYGGRQKRVRHLYDLLVRQQTLGYEFGWSGLILLGLVMLVLLLGKSWVLLLTLPILVLAVALFLSRDARPARRMTMLLIAVGVALTMGVEYIVLKGDIGRMNTVFKFYLQVWMLWGIAAAVGLAYLFKRQARWSLSGAKTWNTALVALLIGVSLYPIFATYGKVRDRWDSSLPGGLDGAQYMTTARYADNGREMALIDDWQAITWMQDHIVGSPVIAEANTPEYRWGNRVSIYTGLPSIIGWNWHQKQQRMAVNGIVVDWRQQDLRDLYNTLDTNLAQQILERYNVGYVYVGELERAYYDAQGLNKFDQMVGSSLDVAYQQGPVTIYRVRGSGAREVQADAASREARLTPWDWVAKYWIPATVRAEEPEKVPSGNLTDGQTERTLMLDVPVDQFPTVDNRGWNWLGIAHPMLAILSWWVVLQVIGLAAWPLVARLVPQFHDRGYGLAKGLGLVIVSYLVWIGASLRVAANSPPTAWLAVAALGVGSFFLWRRQRPGLADEWPRARRLIWLEEGLFTLAFLAFAGVRVLNPDLWQPWFGGEKTMEIAILNALTKSAYMPPYDPYFAGGYLNYYYYGQFIAALLMKLTGLPPEVGFNLAVPTFFALTVSHVFMVGYHLANGSRRRSAQAALTPAAPVPDGEVLMDGGGIAAPVAGVAVAPAVSRAGLWGGGAAALLVAVLGNLSGIVQVVEEVARLGGATFENGRVIWRDVYHFTLGFGRLITGQARALPFDYWYRGTRIIPYTINEFPFFSFLFADLHPHMIGIPFTVLVIALFLGLLTEQGQDRTRSALRWGALALSVGALGAINTWDLPAYLGMLGLIMLYRGYHREGARGILGALPSFMLLTLTALLLYAPFYANYQAQQLGLALVSPAERVQPGPFLLIWGLFMLLLVSALGLWLTQGWRRWSRLTHRLGWAGAWHRAQALNGARLWLWPVGLLLLVGGLSAGVMLAVSGMAVLGLLVAMLVAAAVSLLSSGRRQAGFLQRLLVLVGLAILLGVELIYLKDFLAGSDWRRMNTVFKFYIQAWVLLGVALGSALPALWRRLSAIRGLGGVWQGVVSLLVASSLVYVVMAVPNRVNERFPGDTPARDTLDGTAYMTNGVYEWPDPDHPIELSYEREAIEWLWQNVRGTPVIAEAPLGFYREGGLRVSSYTGLPTLLGAHEWEQRPADQVGVRQHDAATLYETTDISTLYAILEQYRVQYIYVGQLERIVYPSVALLKFEQLVTDGRLERVYRNEQVDIYRVVGEWAT